MSSTLSVTIKKIVERAAKVSARINADKVVMYIAWHSCTRLALTGQSLDSFQLKNLSSLTVLML